MKRVIALFLSLMMLLSLAACVPGVEEQSTDAVPFTVPMDDASYVYQVPQDATPLPGGAIVALAAESSALESGADALL